MMYDQTAELDISPYKRSLNLYEAACQVIPGGVNSNIRKDGLAMPLFFSKGIGPYLWDVDGNQYIDYALAFGPCILGHNPPVVQKAILDTLKHGQVFGGQHEKELELAKLICEVVPCAEMVRFSMSGSEANHAAFRVARTFTGRTKIVKFEGHYHGWYDNEYFSFKPSLEEAGSRESPQAVLMSKGMAASGLEDVIVLPWNDLETLEKCFASHAFEIAAVITEPIMYNCGGILPLPGYLEGMRELCSRYGVLLILDEVITGFRVALGGAQQLFKITPDLATFAKAIAGGVQISALAGKREIMSLFAHGETTHAGT
jgi:glutamate-1-semialdehyde 2,1-aminomutase